MTDNKEDLLLELAKARENYAAIVEAIDADLKAERERRLGKYQEEIRSLVVRSFVAGARKSHIMRAYSTKDYGTINNILVAAGAEAEVIEKIEYVEPKPWYEIRNDTLVISDGLVEAEFEVEHLEEGVILLVSNDDLYPNGFDALPNPIVSEWDGVLLDGACTGSALELYQFLADPK